ncbi:hypothetical protein HELRODRAFT_170012 [Helobdella robusta]|uniref:Uncharacterized protein n=1 Tax=Helobdella robusta TaxID=6412 RepID=T1F2I9_HELRO|nr:hypothetical protein HELRODRAFT_170012 [Helobdella robusta]ESO07480.1 hypothetical protein HELRODRAFT_170012 [Helobdella robusta]
MDRCFGICVVSSCLLNFLLPVSIVYAGYALTCIIRLAQGLVEGMLYPSCYDVLRIWSLPEEKSRMGATVLTGDNAGHGKTSILCVSRNSLVALDCMNWSIIMLIYKFFSMPENVGVLEELTAFLIRNAFVLLDEGNVRDGSNSATVKHI